LDAVARLLEGHSAKTIKNRCLMLTTREELRQSVQREQQKGAFLEAMMAVKLLKGEAQKNKQFVAIVRRYLIREDRSVTKNGIMIGILGKVGLMSFEGK
jgi:hypothetical protein